MNEQMVSGRISRELPFIREKAVELLKADYPDRDAARQRIVEGINSFYRTNYPAVYDGRRALVERSAQAVAAIYLRNIFPEMKVTWGVHSNNIGHTDFPGCSTAMMAATGARTEGRLPTTAPPATICWPSKK